MNPQNIWLKRTGLGLNVLIAVLLLFAGASKLLGFMPAEEVAKMGIWKEKMLLVGCGEVVTAVLFLGFKSWKNHRSRSPSSRSSSPTPRD